MANAAQMYTVLRGHIERTLKALVGNSIFDLTAAAVLFGEVKTVI